MRKLSLVCFAALGLLAITLAIRAQSPPAPPKPGPEHEKLAYFAGKWISEGDMKASPFGPAGKFTFTETCEWLTGNFALICHSEGPMFGTTIKGVSIMSYDGGEKSYVYFESNSIGENTYSHGTVDGDNWNWTGDSKMDGKLVHTRFTMKRLSPDVASYKFEIASGSDPFQLVMEGKQTRQK